MTDITAVSYIHLALHEDGTPAHRPPCQLILEKGMWNDALSLTIQEGKGLSSTNTSIEVDKFALARLVHAYIEATGGWS